MLSSLINETVEKSLERILTELTKSDVGGYTEVTYLETQPDHRNFDPTRCMDTEAFLDFIQRSQPEKYKAVIRRNGDLGDVKILEAFCMQVDKRGLLNVLKKGFEVTGVKLAAMFFRPEDETDLQSTFEYNQNSFYCARQFHYSKVATRKSIDLVLLINGIPVVAVELKNLFTGQNVKDAMRQFCKDRDQNELFFKLNHRCLVMFAVDNYTVEMTTKLDGDKTLFLPFNQGSNGPGRKGDAGNPIPEDNVPTHYMFDDILTKDSLQRIIADFMVFDDDDENPRVIFPRYHQLHCVQTMIKIAHAQGPGHSYLIQHSAGSGKSNTIAWLAFRLLYMQEHGESVYDSVIICVHRTVLNEQLNQTVSLFQYLPHMVVPVESSAELKEALLNGKKVIVSTIQKFGMINESLKPFKKNYPIIFDEAHTSTTGRLNKKTKLALGIHDITPEEYDQLSSMYDSEEEILRQFEKIKHEGRQDNLSFYAFTATPTEKTLHAFGKRLDNGSYVAHHIYSMRQAIDEGFIVDVLKDYTTYTGYFDMISQLAGSNDPRVDSAKALRILKKLRITDTRILKKNARVIVQYFRDYVDGDLDGEAKAMLVVDGRENVIGYRDAIIEVCKEEGYEGIKIMTAFSGTLDYNGEQVTEQFFNILPDGRRVKSKEMADVFDGPHFNLMIAADKFQVGFDQKKLTTMFVDKTLRDVEAVQTLSRLNRVYPGKEKNTHVLDFRNSADDIFKAFSTYYEDTESEEGYDPTFVYVKRMDLEAFGVIDENDVLKFAEKFDETDPEALKFICGLLEPARQRFLILSEDEQARFRKMAKSLERQYGVVTIQTAFMDPYFKDLVNFIHYLLKVLPKSPSEPLPNIEELVSVDHYRLVFTGNTSIQLSKGEPLPNPSDQPTDSSRKIDLLSEVIKKLNARWALPDFNDEDKLSFMEGVQKDIENEISKRGKLSDYSDWTSESFEKEFMDTAKLQIIKRAKSTNEFYDALKNDTDAVNYLASSILKTILFSPKKDEEE